MKSSGLPLALTARTRKGFTLFWAAIFVMSLVMQYTAAALPSPVFAVHVNDLFELDGNAVDGAAAGDDWDQVYGGTSNADSTQFISDATDSATDETFTGGSTKDDLPLSGWKWSIGAPPNKNDITHAFAAAYTDPDDSHTIAYFGLNKWEADGDNFVGFWFFKNAIGRTGTGSGSGSPFTGSHAVGDILVLANYTNGGAIADFDVYRWVGSGGDVNGTLATVASGVPCAGGAADIACGATNAATEPAPWPFDGHDGPPGEFPPATLFEGGIDLTALGLDTSCFTSFMAETRSSQSVDAVLKDFALGEFSFCETPGLTTQVSDDVILTGGSVTDTATLSGNKGPVEGTVQFAVCGPSATAPDCTSGGVLVGTSVTIVNGSATSAGFSPTQPGMYCFRAEFTPATGSKYLAAEHTNLTTECFTLVPAPTVQVVKVADPTSLNEPGGTVTFSVDVTNTSPHDVVLTSLVDDIHGDLNGQGTCSTGGTIAASATYSCEFEGTVSGNAGDSETDTVEAVVTDEYEQTADDSDDATVQIVDVLPVIEVVKTANPTLVPETGEDVTYTVVVTNHSIEAVEITALEDDIYGSLAGDADCQIGTVLAANGGSCTFDFTEFVSGTAGSSLTDIVTADAVDDDGNTATADDDATVLIDNVLPLIQVIKLANPTNVEEPGGNVTFSVEVTNVGPVSLTITSLDDDVYGALAGDEDCQIGTTLAPTASCSFSFVGAVEGNAGDVKTDIVTVCGVDIDQSEACDDDDADVEITDALPDISVVKSADPIQLDEPGGTVTFTVEVTNNSVEPVFLTSLIDNVHGDLNGQGDCVADGTVEIAVGGTYTCSFEAEVTGNAGYIEIDIVDACAQDDEKNEACDEDDAQVEITDLLPVISVLKTANPTSIQEPGATVTFTVTVTNESLESVTITSLVDDKFGSLVGDDDCKVGTVLAIDGSCTFDFTGTVNGSAGQQHVNTVTAEAMDNDENTATADDDAVVTITALPGRIIIEKQTNPDGSNQSFTFSASWEEGTFNLTDGQQHVSDLLAGSYNVEEINIPTGWTLTGVTGTGCNVDGKVSISLQAGQTVHCIFTNTLPQATPTPTPTNRPTPPPTPTPTPPPTPSPTPTPTPTGSVLTETATPRITLPPTSTLENQQAVATGVNLGLLLVLFSGLMLTIGLLTPVPAEVRRRDRQR